MQYVGVDFAKRLCGVSLIRSGESMETALRACCQGIKIGKILVHRCGCAQLDYGLCHLADRFCFWFPVLGWRRD